MTSKPALHRISRQDLTALVDPHLEPYGTSLEFAWLALDPPYLSVESGYTLDGPSQEPFGELLLDLRLAGPAYQEDRNQGHPIHNYQLEQALRFMLHQNLPRNS